MMSTVSVTQQRNEERLTAAVSKQRLVKLSIVYHVFLVISSSLVNFLFEDFDSSTWIFQQETRQINYTSITSLLTNGLSKWDSVYFNHIAEHSCGYEYEQMLAFAPGFPYLVHLFSSWLYSMLGESSLNTEAIGIILNLIFNAIATALIYRLTCKVLHEKVKDVVKERFAVVATLAFIFNPANIFMISNYSESMFVAIQFAILLELENSSFLLASLLACISPLIRSNGLLNIAFLVYFYAKRVITKEKVYEKNHCRHSIIECLKPTTLYLITKSLYKHLLLILVYIVLSLTPYLAWQYQIYKIFCDIPHIVNSKRNHWCTQTPPFSYSYIQSHYWKVGFLKYFTFSQIPNFLMATPVCFIVFGGVYLVTSNNTNFKSDVLPWLGFKEAQVTNAEVGTILSADRTFVYVCHALFLTIFGILNVHVQILTRMIFSSTPFVYWTIAELVVDRRMMKKKFKRRLLGFIFGYFILYTILGLFLHSNFYPWT